MSHRPGGPRAPDAAYAGDPRTHPQMQMPIPAPNVPYNHGNTHPDAPQRYFESESDIGDPYSRRNTYASEMEAGNNPYYDQPGGEYYCKYCHFLFFVFFVVLSFLELCGSGQKTFLGLARSWISGHTSLNTILQLRAVHSYF